MVVIGVEPGSLGEVARIRPGDQIISVDTQRLRHPKTLYDYIAKRKRGDTITLTIENDGDNRDVVMVLDRPQSIISFCRFEHTSPRRWDYGVGQDAAAIEVLESSPEIHNNVIWYSTGNGITLNGQSPTASYNTIAYCGGTGISLKGAEPTAHSNVVLDASFWGFAGKREAFEYNCAWHDIRGVGDDDRASFSLDPHFVDPPNGDFRLRPNSPCLTTGKNGTQMGAYGP